MSNNIIGIGGYATSGKDAVADFLVATGRYEKTYMSEPLERALLLLDPMVPKTMFDEGRIYDSGRGSLNGKKYDHGAYERYSVLHARVGYEKSKKNKEVRRLLQMLGTEVGRDLIGKDTWVKIMTDTVTDIIERGNKAVVTGVRYENEMQAIRSMGGRCLWVERPGTGPINIHTSDNTLTAAAFDEVIVNSGTLEDLDALAKHAVGLA